MDLASIDITEYVSIIAAYNKINKDDTEEKLKARGFTADQIKYALSQQTFSPVRSVDVTFTAPIKIECPQFNTYMQLHQAYKLGMLPGVGPVMDQPAKLIDVFNLLDVLIFEAEQAARKDAERKAKRVK